MNTDFFKDLQERFQINAEMVETVRLGDVMFQIESSKLSLEQLIERITEDLVHFKNINNDTMVDFCQNKIDAYNICLDMFDKLYSNIQRKAK